MSTKKTEAPEPEPEAEATEAETAPESTDDAPDDGAYQHAGHTATLKAWEDSPEGQAFIEEVGGERQTKADAEDKSKTKK